MTGYFNDLELTSETLVDGWLRTGDLGWIDASEHLHLVGRQQGPDRDLGGQKCVPRRR